MSNTPPETALRGDKMSTPTIRAALERLIKLDESNSTMRSKPAAQAWKWAIAAALARWGRPATPPTLPANYIDPEHHGEDLELLETFYRAWKVAEGDTADEIYLRGIRAVLAARPAAQPAPDVAGLAAWLEQYRDLLHPVHDSDDIVQFTRAATLLQQLSAPAPPAPEEGGAGGLGTLLRVGGSCGGGAALSPEQCRRTATLLQQQESRIANLRSALADCGRAAGAAIGDDCSDDFLLVVPAEVRLAVAKPAPAAVSVAVSERLPDPRPESEGGDCDEEGRCWIHQPRPESPETPEWRLAQAKYASANYGTTHWAAASAIPLPQAGEVEG